MSDTERPRVAAIAEKHAQRRRAAQETERQELQHAIAERKLIDLKRQYAEELEIASATLIESARDALALLCGLGEDDNVITRKLSAALSREKTA